MTKTEVVPLTKELADKIDLGDFNRSQSNYRVRSIAEAFANGSKICPPIIVSKIGKDKYILIDGQHRFEAWKLKPYPLFAMVADEMTHEKAIESFIEINAKSVRVPLKHRMKVDPSPVAKRIREVANRFELAPVSVMRMAVQLVAKPSSRSGSAYSSYNVTLDIVGEAEKIIELWVEDWRWRSDKQVYKHPGVLVMVGFLLRHIKNRKGYIQVLRNHVDFGATKPLANFVGTGSGHQKFMIQYVLKRITRHLIKAGIR